MDIINAIANTEVNKYMIDTKIPPHITISFFCTEEIGKIQSMLDNHYSDFTVGNVTWASLGVFVPNVLFAAPVMNEYLLKACETANQLVKQFADIADDGHYLPNQWVPHTTLATKLNPDELKIAFNTALQHFSAFTGICNRLTLAQCNPFKKLKTWDLTEEKQ